MGVSHGVLLIAALHHGNMKCLQVWAFIRVFPFLTWNSSWQRVMEKNRSSLSIFMRYTLHRAWTTCCCCISLQSRDMGVIQAGEWWNGSQWALNTQWHMIISAHALTEWTVWMWHWLQIWNEFISDASLQLAVSRTMLLSNFKKMARRKEDGQLVSHFIIHMRRWWFILLCHNKRARLHN